MAAIRTALAGPTDLFGHPLEAGRARRTARCGAWFREMLAYELALLGPPPAPPPSAQPPAAVVVIGCSASKCRHAGELPAWRRYDGPIWRTLRTHWTPGSATRVYVLSARHGLIPAETPIADYDTRLQDVVGHRAPPGRGRHRPVTAAERIAETWANRGTWERLERSPHLFVVAGAAYRRVIDRWATRPYAHATGGIGEQRAALRRWLADRPSLEAAP